MRELWFKQPLESMDEAQREAYELRREQCLAAAERLMAKRGLAVPMSEIASEAGLGMSGLYRTYASKDELIADVANRRGQLWLDVWTAAAERTDDPKHALIDALWTLCEIQAAEPGLGAVLGHYARGHRHEFAAVEQAGATVVERAKPAGLRPDATYEDVVGVFRMVPDFFPDGDRSWRRALQLIIDGLFATNAASLPEPDPVRGQAPRREAADARVT